MSDCLAMLNHAVAGACKPEGRGWFDEAIKQLNESSPTGYSEQLPLLLARARRKLGTQRISADSDHIIVTEFSGAGQAEVDISHWDVAEAARVALLLQAQMLMPEKERVALVEQCYRLGDESERGAIMRGLILFQQCEALKPLALMTGRTNSLTFFSTIAHFNPYPAMYYSDDEFNQLALKALFSGIGVALIEGLKRRANHKLSSMCEDYIDERNDAGRTIPVDIWLALMPYASKRAEGMVLSALEDEDPAQRYYAGLALGAALGDQPELRQALEKRVALEQLIKVRSVLEQALAQ